MTKAFYASTALTRFPRGFDNTSTSAGAITVRDMSPNTNVSGDEMLKRSPDSAAMVDYWDQTDTIIDGIKALRLAREKYLPKFVDEDEKEYDFRVNATKLTNVYRDIIEGLASKPFEEEISLVTSDKEGSKVIPQQITEFIEDVDGSGNNLTVFSSGVFFNGINSAIDWIFVDFPTVDPSQVRSVADAKAAGVRPFWSRVLGRNVLEAKTAMIGGKEVLTYMRIFEPGKPDHVRVFERNATGVTWQLYVKTDRQSPNGKTMFVLEREGVISIGVIPLVPFITGRRDGRTFRIFPTMQDAADLQIELYQQESGLKFVKIMAAYPMLAAQGVNPPVNADGTPKKLRVGPGVVLYGKPNADGKAGTWAFVEPSANTMKFLADDVKSTIENLREIGRQPLTAQSSNVTVINSAVAAGKARTAVGAWALQLKDALENALVLTCQWLNIKDYSPEVNVYTEFDDFADGNADLTELGNARRAKDLSRYTYWAELKRRKVLAPEFDAEAEDERLLEELPAEGLDDAEDDNKSKPPIAA
ncbi:DUF4055 domain-containing protein [Mesorhizobium sp. M1A.F.Ca.ET.072.01.1.1]|uniref:DUF4055 domain-containing protein n=1 Tax=Mesorhizobium sp. M1A.F.Ca.ET.072.01.1.1 TaxID=2496753 RepID=UPI000FD1CAF1|nr:DUF4055 domain-containing protein [Mesorhizobium sp. M1A.F.Ca.ET.072.01.1.1]RUW55596.1 DUF4055 domain-containing protein [Mesorhizobium sp. M1A.F.Ca.ET.072.01.1.1]